MRCEKSINISVVIPSYKDRFLHKTIEDILENFTDSFEIIPVVDGYELDRQIIDDPRVKPIILKNNGGMRNAINVGVKESSGKYVMRADEHCMFARGFDAEITSHIEPNWIVTARRYFLDPHKWEVMKEKGYVDYEKLAIRSRKGKEQKFTGVTWYSRRRKRENRKIDETMAMQGSCWVMPRSWWDSVVKELQTEGYGPHYQDSVEMLFKTWKAGGRLMVNKNTWFAHKWKGFNRSHQYSNLKAEPEWKYALDTWRDDYEIIRQKWRV